MNGPRPGLCIAAGLIPACMSATHPQTAICEVSQPLVTGRRFFVEELLLVLVFSYIEPPLNEYSQRSSTNRICLDPGYRHLVVYLRCPSATFILWHLRSVLESLPSVRVRSLSISSSHDPHNRVSRLATTQPLLLERVGTPHKRTNSSSAVNGDSFRYSCSQVFRRVDAMRNRGLDQVASTNVTNDNFVSEPLQMTCIHQATAPESLDLGPSAACSGCCLPQPLYRRSRLVSSLPILPCVSVIDLPWFFLHDQAPRQIVTIFLLDACHSPSSCGLHDFFVWFAAQQKRSLPAAFGSHAPGLRMVPGS